MSRSPYDLVVLTERAAQWRAEAASAKLEAMRVFCLTEADRCEQRVQMSLFTPVIRDARARPSEPAPAGWDMAGLDTRNPRVVRRTGT